MLIKKEIVEGVKEEDRREGRRVGVLFYTELKEVNSQKNFLWRKKERSARNYFY